MWLEIILGYRSQSIKKDKTLLQWLFKIPTCAYIRYNATEFLEQAYKDSVSTRKHISVIWFFWIPDAGQQNACTVEQGTVVQSRASLSEV